MESDRDATSGIGKLDTQIRSTLENLLEGAQIVDRDWRYVYVNPAAARHGGRSVEELVGRTMIEAYPGIEHTPMFEVLRGSMESGLSAEMQNEFVLPDGERKWFQLLIHPVPEGLFVLSLDITDRRAAEEELRSTRARMEAIIENLDQGLILADLDGNVVHANRAALAILGLGPHEARGHLRDFSSRFELFTMDGDPIPPEERPLARVVRGEQFRDAEVRLARTDQQWERTLSYNGMRIDYDEGKAVALVTIEDVTARKELARQFVHAQRMESIGALAGGIAHDLNNVLMPILMGTGLLRNLGLGERGVRTVDNIERSARRGAELVKQVLSFARGSAAVWSVVDVRSVITEVEAIMRSTFPKHISVAAEIPAGRYAVMGDATQLRQAMLNLCVHARDAMPGGGRVTISVGLRTIGNGVALEDRIEPGQYVNVQIRDEGLAIPPEVLEHIFEGSAGAPDPSAASFGLFTVQEIVRGHGGFVDVVSVTGKGTTFCLCLPVEGTSGAVNDVEAAPRGDGQLILVVDDETSIVTIVQQTLEAYGYEVLAAEDGAQAIALYAARRSEISLVLTDMMMPVLDGTALISALLHMNPQVPIIATSGTQAHDWKARAKRVGARHFLAKPYSAPVLLRLVAEVLAAGR